MKLSSGGYGIAKPVVDIAVVSIVRWVEVQKNFNSTRGTKRVSAHSSRCGMEKRYDNRTMGDNLCSSVAGDKKLRMQVADIYSTRLDCTMAGNVDKLQFDYR